MNRTAERILSVISAIFTLISIILGFISLSLVKMMIADDSFRAEFEAELFTNPNLTSEEAELMLTFIDFFEGFIWLLIAILIISFIATVIGIIFIWNNKKPKLAGVFFIFGGLFAFILTPTSIMLYIAAILCFIKKPPRLKEEEITPFYGNRSEDGMRPL